MRRKRQARLEMTALMDVMFLVLVFFVYCISDMAVHRGVPVELPEAAGSVETGERIVITIRADNSLQLNGRDRTKEEVIACVKNLLSVKVKLPVLVCGDRRADLGVGVELLSALKAAGVEKTTFRVSDSP